MLEKEKKSTEEDTGSLSNLQRVQADTARSMIEFDIALMEDGRKAVLSNEGTYFDRVGFVYKLLYY